MDDVTSRLLYSSLEVGDTVYGTVWYTVERSLGYSLVVYGIPYESRIPYKGHRPCTAVERLLGWFLSCLVLFVAYGQTSKHQNISFM